MFRPDKGLSRTHKIVYDFCPDLVYLTRLPLQSTLKKKADVKNKTEYVASCFSAFSPGILWKGVEHIVILHLH